MMDMEANDNREGPAFEDRKAWLMAMAASLEPGADGYAGRRELIRQLDAIEPGIIDHMHARQVAKALGIPPLGLRGGPLPDLSALDYAEA
jgi:hypothetical protein